MTIIRSQLSHSRDNDISKTQKTSLHKFALYIQLRNLRIIKPEKRSLHFVN
ncbi:unnamed protein product [Larinioides sclopetarius]|uniref:Uncharacterized protein n=1 Tax=Larinioides sclopetarius TaxID=280406 RepID=A0AAV1YR63_9ARAC